MIGEYTSDGGVGSKKRSLTSPGNSATSEESIMNPPTKKLKQARLPFKVISSPSPNQCNKPSITSPLPSKKRKLSGSDRPKTLNHPIKVKSLDVTSSAKKAADISAKKFFVKKISPSPVTPKNSRVETIDLDPEVSSSCEDQESSKLTSAAVTPKRSLSTKPKSLDSFLQITQQPQVSTSDDLLDLSDDDILIINETESPAKKNEELSATETLVVAVESSHQGNAQEASPSEKTSTTCTPETEKVSDDKESEIKEEESGMDVSMASCPDDSATASKLSYDADSEDGDGDDDDRSVINKSSQGSSEAESSTSGSPSIAGATTPKEHGKPVKKTPLSAKALKKLKEKEQLREEKIKLRMEKKRKLQEGEAERKRQKLELKREKELEREEARKQKEMEKDVKRKERQQKKEQEEKEKEQKRMAREEERRKKQETIDAKMEEKRKKNEERQRQEEEKQKQEEEKREKEAKQKTFFKGFFKEVVVPVKKPQEKTCGWFAPFQVKADMVLAPVRRCQKLPEDLEELDATFQNQNSSSLYLDILKSKTYIVGKSGRTPPDESEVKESSSRTVTPSVEKMQQDGDSQDVEIVSKISAKPVKKLVRMKCKLLQFHENYRPAYYGTWRQTSRAINPRNYLKKDEELLDYEVDSDDEWEEPGESLSHSEGEDDGEEVDEGGDSDDGFFVPHGYLSESEGCEDDEEVENWKERRAAKAKSWEVELKRQQGVLKPILIGCIWATGSQQPTNKTLDAYKIVALPTVTKKQAAAASETQSVDPASKSSSQPMWLSSEVGASLKRPVPAEAMSDLIRLVHGNAAGIKTLQREFREYWRLKKSGHTMPRPVTPMTSEASQAVKTSLEESPMVGAESPLPGATGGEVPGTPVGNEVCPVPLSPCVQTARKESTPASDGGTPEVSASQSPAMTPGDSTECSISKRQLMITINDIAVREKRPQFPRTCWYVHQHILEKYNLQDLPVPGQWQNLTKPQKALRAESPLVGHSLPGSGTQTTSGYTAPTQAVYTAVVIQNNPVVLGSGQQPMTSGMYVSNSSMQMSQPSLMTAGPNPNPNPPSGINQESCVSQGIRTTVPFANSVSACEIMQRFSATLPSQLNQSPPTLSANPAHVLNPIMPTQMHYLNMIPKPHGLSPQAVTFTTQNKSATSCAVKVPHTSPNDIKALLSSQAAKLTASPTNIKPESRSTVISDESPAGFHGNTQESVPPTTQKPSIKTLKNFFSFKPHSKAQQETETSDSQGKSNTMDETKNATDIKDTVHPKVADDKEKPPSCMDVGQGKVERNQEEMEVIEIN